ncbi:actin cytoskeleton-regulatory complex protein pan-1-like [Arachis stenosperma]|uniref:actin cytoskeleton-regulatory complex protein pan-1-like n=1 Tax=Arachis stenosperma TaxID=217475 RepID=UPI0025AD4851|nr:actin cytoskeleton-regulatory complex protein pan-1-like [Arachis stenosperma]
MGEGPILGYEKNPPGDEAKAKSRARSGGSKAVVSPPPPPPPPPRNVGTPSQPILISSSSSLARPLPSAQLLSEPEKKRRKTSESGPSWEGGVKADAQAFVRKNIYPLIPMDDASVRSHLTALAEESFRAAGVCGKLLDIFEKTPLSSLGTSSKVAELEGRLLLFEKHQEELKEERDKLRKERDVLREKESQLRAQCTMEVRVIAPDLDLSPLHPDKVVIDGAIVDPPPPEVLSESDLKTRGQRIIESPPHSKDVPSSSTPAPTSSSAPPPGPGDVPPGGGDSSAASKK